jgi:hypothetical protein
MKQQVLKFAPKFLSKRLLIPETLFEDIFPRLLDEALLGQDEGGRGGHAAVVVLLRHLKSMLNFFPSSLIVPANKLRVFTPSKPF